MLRLAGFVGVDPTPLTFYELSEMAFGKHQQEWEHTASVIAMLANTVRDPKKRSKAYAAEDFYPKQFLRKRAKQPKENVPISVLKEVFIDGRLNVNRTGNRVDRSGPGDYQDRLK